MSFIAMLNYQSMWICSGCVSMWVCFCCHSFLVKPNPSSFLLVKRHFFSCLLLTRLPPLLILFFDAWYLFYYITYTHYTYIFIYIYTLYIYICVVCSKKRRCFFQWFLTPPRRHYHLQAPPGDGNQARPGGDVCHHGLLHWVWRFGLAFTRSKWD